MGSLIAHIWAASTTIYKQPHRSIWADELTAETSLSLLLLVTRGVNKAHSVGVLRLFKGVDFVSSRC